MTRINLVPVETLTGPHLIAEWRELPRVFKLAYNAHTSGRDWWANRPDEYVMGTGHVTFFYDKLEFLAWRHEKLTMEMLRRGYKPSTVGNLKDLWREHIPAQYWNSYFPTAEAIQISQQRIDERNAK